MHHLANGKWAITNPPIPMHTAKNKGKTKTNFMKTMELKAMGLNPIETRESVEINGGLSWWSKAISGASVFWSAVSNFGDIREGFSDGWNGKKPRH